MKALVVGAAGFVGRYLVKHLRDDLGWNVYTTKLAQEQIYCENVQAADLDILNPKELSDLLKWVQPDCIFHLAAQSSVALSWENPELTVDINIKGTINLLEALRLLGQKPRVLLVGSGEEYGPANEADMPLREDMPVHPANVYAATKACQNMLGTLYTNAYGLDAVMVRAFNHIGPGQSAAFVVSDFCRQIAEIENNMRIPKLFAGNLDVKRDFTDVRDVVKAYALLVQYGRRGETYNVGQGRAVAIKEILNRLLGMSAVSIETAADPQKYRPSDVPLITADIAKLKAHTGWTPQIPLDRTLHEVLDDWRKIISRGQDKHADI